MRRALIGATILGVGLVGAFVPAASGQPTSTTEPAPTTPATSPPTSDSPTTDPPAEPPTTTSTTSTTSAPATSTTTVPADPAPVSALDATVPGGFVDEAPDFATRAWSDPLDMSNADDMLRNFGPTYKVSSAAFGGGALGFYLSGNGYVSPLWTGFPGSLQMLRDGTLSANSINASTFRYLSFRMQSSEPLSGAALFWSNCNRHIPSCEGGMPLSVSSLGDGGWHTYTFRIANNTGFKRYVPWSGSMHGLRLALNKGPGRTPRVKIDWIRFYEPGKSGMLSGVPANTESLYYSGNGATCEQLAGVGNTDLSALPPGTYEFSTDYACSNPSTPVTVVSRPTPVVTAPNMAGENDYASRVLKNAWDFNNIGDVTKTRNVCGSSYSKPTGAYSAYNCSAHDYINDPSVFLHVGTGSYVINPRVYHRATVTFHYDGAFDLHDSCGGGTIARLMWLNTRYPGKIMQTKDWMTYTDRLVYTFDLASPTAVLNEEGATNKYPFVVPAGYYATMLRWDPNEDRCARKFRLYDVKLTADHAPVSGKFNVKWKDARATAGDKVSIYVVNTSVPGSNWIEIANGRANSTTAASFTWNTAGMTHGSYRVLVRVFRNGTANYGDFTATGPVTF